MNLDLSSIPPKEFMPGYHGKLVHAEHIGIANENLSTRRPSNHSTT